MKIFALKKMRIAFALLIILTSIPVAGVTKANARSYFVSNYDIKMNITSDGSANVVERITFSFNGAYNGVYLNIDTSGSSGIRNMRLSVLKGVSEIPVTESGSNAPETYTLSTSGSVNEYKVYEPSQDEDKTFIFRYRLLNTVANYNDVAEFDRLVIAKNWVTELNNVKITITIPKGAQKSDLKVYGHGPLTGSSKIIDARTVEFTDAKVPAYTFVEAIVLFPPSLTSKNVNKFNIDKLKSIVDREQKLADTANAEREKARQSIKNENRVKTIGYFTFGFLFIIWIVVLIFIYNKYDKELRPEFTGSYYRELPGEYSPAEMTLIMGDGLGSKDIMATLLDLSRRRHLKIEKVEIEKKGVFRTKKIDDYMFTLLENNNDKLATHENNLLVWLMNSVGTGNSFSIEDLKDHVEVKENAINFSRYYSEWKKEVNHDFDKLKTIDNSNANGKVLGIFVGGIYVVIGIVLFILTQYVIAFITGILGVIMIFYSSSFTRRTKYGADQHSKWHGFKRFLEDFSQMKSANISSLVVWEHYLVYAVSLGVAQNVIKYLPELVGEQQLNNANMTNGILLWQLGGFYAFNNAFNNSMNAVDNAVVSAHSIAMSQNSSGIGGGGGFSGGGGFGGGGGGGGGAF